MYIPNNIICENDNNLKEDQETRTDINNIEKQDQVLEATYRFCLKNECVQNIKRCYNNISGLIDQMKVKLEKSCKLNEEQRLNVQFEGCVIEGMP